MKPGPRNLITDVKGLLVGNAQDDILKSGTTVMTSDKPFVASVHVMGKPKYDEIPIDKQVHFVFLKEESYFFDDLQLSLSIFFLLTNPAQNILTRVNESDADAFGLDAAPSGAPPPPARY